MSNNKDFKVKNGIQPTVYHEGLGTVVSGTVGYYLAGASYDSKSFSVSSQETSPKGVFFKSDGTKMYVTGVTSDYTYQYSLSTAWDVSTASYDSVSLANPATSVTDIFFKPDGTELYFAESTNQSNIYRYTLSTAWDLSTATSTNSNTSSFTQVSNNQMIFFKSDGTKLYLGENKNASTDLYEYDLSTAWDITTSSVSYSGNTLETTAQDNEITGLYFKPDGTEFYLVGYQNDAVYKYDLSTAWDISSGTYSSVSVSLTSQETQPEAVTFGDSGNKMYVVGFTNDTIYQYSTAQTTNTLDLSTGSVFEITPTSDIQIDLSNPADSGTVSQATLLLNQEGAGGYDLLNIGTVTSFSVLSQGQYPYGFFMKPDGTKMYIAVNSDDSIDQYSLSTAYDISTASYDSVTLDVSSQDTSPESLWFKPDGTKMYYAGSNGDTVDQYALSTAWDLSTASYESKQLSVSGQMIAPRSIAFNPDGTKLLIAGESNVGGQPADGVWQYTLSTAWDISTASYDSSNLNVGSQSSAPYGIDFNSDGSKMFILDSGGTVYQYSLSTSYTLSGASYDSVSGTTTLLSDIRFVNSGKTLVGIDVNNSEVESYPSSTPATITYDTTLEWPSGTAPTSPAIGETDVITFTTSDGGTSYQAVQAIDGAS